MGGEIDVFIIDINADDVGTQHFYFSLRRKSSQVFECVFVMELKCKHCSKMGIAPKCKKKNLTFKRTNSTNSLLRAWQMTWRVNTVRWINSIKVWDRETLPVVYLNWEIFFVLQVIGKCMFRLCKWDIKHTLISKHVRNRNLYIRWSQIWFMIPLLCNVLYPLWKQNSTKHNN